MNKKTFEKKIDMRLELYGKFKSDTSVFEASDLVEASLRNGGKVLIFGNGGSATQASHFTGELVNRFYFDRPALPCISLTADQANLTCIANDSDYKYVFSRQLEALAKPEDVAIGISTSGTSKNVLEALERAKEKNMKTIALCGRNTEKLQNLDIDVIISIPATDTPAIQELHIFALHLIAEILEQKFFAGDK